MSSKELKFGKELHDEIKIGVQKLVEAVTCTMGVDGKNVIIETPDGYSRVTKDGVSVATSVVLPNPYQNMGAKMIIDSALATVRKIGDGTTTTTLLAGSMYDECMQIIESGEMSHRKLKKQLKKEVEFLKTIVEKIAKHDISYDIMLKIAMVSSNHDMEISKTVAEVYEKVGVGGVVNLKRSDDSKTKVNVSEGFVVPQGYAHKVFCNNKLEFRHDKECFIIVVAGQLDSLKQVAHVIQPLITKQKPIIIFASSFSNDALDSILENRRKDVVIFPLEKPTYGNVHGIDEDFAVITNSIIIDGVETTFQNATVDCVGTISSILSTFEKTSFITSEQAKKSARYLEHLEMIKNQMEAVNSPLVKRQYQERIARIEGKIATIHIGSHTETELEYKMDMYDDCVKATKNCIEHGYVAGGGSTYMFLMKQLEKEFENPVLSDVLKTPFLKLLSNSDVEDEEIKRMLSEMSETQLQNMGYDLLDENHKMKDLVEFGIVEPASLPIACIENASSVAILLFSSQTAISIIPEFSL